MNNSRFFSFHPLSSLIYFLVVIILTMFSSNPLITVISLAGAILFNFYIKTFNSKKALFYLLVFLITALSNPIFSHNGATVLFFLGDNRITLESLLYGANSGLLMVSVIVWCENYSKIMTNDKFLFLFSRRLPKSALIISMTFRFLPIFMRKYRNMVDAQRTFQKFGKSKKDKIRFYVSVFSLLVSWSFENSVDTADSMRARGYTLKSKTVLNRFKFTAYDLYLIVLSLTLLLLILFGIYKNAIDFSFYPIISFPKINTLEIISLISFTALSFLPILTELKESLKWKYLISKI